MKALIFHVCNTSRVVTCLPEKMQTFAVHKRWLSSPCHSASYVLPPGFWCDTSHQFHCKTCQQWLLLCNSVKKELFTERVCERVCKIRGLVFIRVPRPVLLGQRGLCLVLMRAFSCFDRVLLDGAYANSLVMWLLPRWKRPRSSWKRASSSRGRWWWWWESVADCLCWT